MNENRINDPAEMDDGRELEPIAQELRNGVPAHTIGGIDRYVETGHHWKSSPIGHGATEQEAIDDLLEQLEACMCSNCSGDYEDPDATNGEPIEESEQERPVVWPSPLLRKTKLDVPFDELEATT